MTLLVAHCSNAESCEPVKIAVIDTGLDMSDSRFNHLCKAGSRNFAQDKNGIIHPTDLFDNHGHGTHVAGLIEKYAGSTNYCMMIYKYYSETATGAQNQKAMIKSIYEAIKNGAKIINISGGGPSFDTLEYFLIKLNPSVLFVVAAGNEGKNIDNSWSRYFPASYQLPNEIVVGAIDKNNRRAAFSNFGRNVSKWEVGTDVISTLPGHKTGSMQGTSQATAIYSGKLVASHNNLCHIN